MTTGFSRQGEQNNTAREPAGIVGVDVVARTATAMLRSRYTVAVNCAYAVGDTYVLPNVGEQWYVERFDMEWRLSAQIPFNDATLNIAPEAGQRAVGSPTGPLELMGTQINLNGPLNTQSVATSVRPDPASVPAGTQVYDATLGKPIWSNGTIWTDAVGTAV